MSLPVLLVLVPGILSIVFGIAANIGLHRRSMLASAALIAVTVVVLLGAQGWSMLAAFSSVADAPPEFKQSLLADAITQMQTTASVGGLTIAIGLGLVLTAWRRIRKGEDASK